MSEHDEKFTLENLDHLSEEFAQSDSSLPEVRLLQDLQRAQKARDRIVTHATERVWQRLLASEHLKETAARDMHSTAPMPFQSHTKNIRKGISHAELVLVIGQRCETRNTDCVGKSQRALVCGVDIAAIEAEFEFVDQRRGEDV